MTVKETSQEKVVRFSKLVLLFYQFPLRGCLSVNLVYIASTNLFPIFNLPNIQMILYRGITSYKPARISFMHWYFACFIRIRYLCNIFWPVKFRLLLWFIISLKTTKQRIEQHLNSVCISLYIPSIWTTCPRFVHTSRISIIPAFPWELPVLSWFNITSS